jgi:hypothetical protein
MTSTIISEGGRTIAPAFISNGTGGVGYTELVSQSSTPAAPASGLRLFADASSRLSWEASAGIVSTFATGATANRVYTLPDLTDTLITITSTATLQNKTVVGGSLGNDISGNKIGGIAVASTTPADTQVLTYSSGGTQWTIGSQQSGWWIFGDGNDGDVTITGGTTTLARDMYYNNLTISASGILETAGYRVFVAGTFSHAGIVRNNGAAGSGLIGGAQAAAGSLGGGSNGGNANSSAAGSAGGAVGAATQLGGVGGAGAAGSAGSGGSVSGASPPATTDGGTTYFRDFYRGTFLKDLSNTRSNGGNGGSGGGSATGGVNFGGGGGGGGGVIMIACASLTGNGSITANGGAGADTTGPTGASSGGGGGGGGGVLVLIYGSDTSTVTTAAAGGAGGSGRSGTNGNSGGTGLVYRTQLL